MTIVFIYPMNFDIIGNTVFINRMNHYEPKGGSHELRCKSNQETVDPASRYEHHSTDTEENQSCYHSPPVALGTESVGIAIIVELLGNIPGTDLADSLIAVVGAGA